MVQQISIIGCGWLGLPLAAALAAKGYAVKGSTTTEGKLEKIENAGVQGFVIDLSTLDLAADLPTAMQPFFETDLLYINIPPTGRDPLIEANYPKWIAFLAKQCVQFGIKQVIFVGSTGIYPDTNAVVTEATAPAPQTTGQRGIVAAEKLLSENPNFCTTILRPAGLVGNGRNPARWFAGRHGLSGGEAIVNLVHLDDCIGVSAAVIAQEQFGDIFNICSEKHYPREILYPALAMRHDLEPPTFVKDDQTAFKIVSNEKSKTVLNYVYSKPDPLLF